MDLVRKLLMSPMSKKRNTNNSNKRLSMPVCSNLSANIPLKSRKKEDAANKSSVSMSLHQSSSSLLSNSEGNKELKYFGECLEDILARERGKVPQLVVVASQFICDKGLQQEGLFRVSGNARAVENLKMTIGKDGEVAFKSNLDVGTVASLLKMFFRQLPDSLIPYNMTDSFLNLISDDPDSLENTYKELKRLVDKLPTCNYNTLKYLVRLLVLVARHEPHNKMSPQALGIVFGPNIFRTSINNQGLTNYIVTCFIKGYDSIFRTKDEVLSQNIGEITHPNIMRPAPLRPKRHSESPRMSAKKIESYEDCSGVQDERGEPMTSCTSSSPSTLNNEMVQSDEEVQTPMQSGFSAEEPIRDSNDESQHDLSCLDDEINLVISRNLFSHNEDIEAIEESGQNKLIKGKSKMRENVQLERLPKEKKSLTKSSAIDSILPHTPLKNFCRPRGPKNRRLPSDYFDPKLSSGRTPIEYIKKPLKQTEEKVVTSRPFQFTQKQLEEEAKKPSSLSHSKTIRSEANQGTNYKGTMNYTRSNSFNKRSRTEGGIHCDSNEDEMRKNVGVSSEKDVLSLMNLIDGCLKRRPSDDGRKILPSSSAAAAAAGQEHWRRSLVKVTKNNNSTACEDCCANNNRCVCSEDVRGGDNDKEDNETSEETSDNGTVEKDGEEYDGDDNKNDEEDEDPEDGCDDNFECSSKDPNGDSASAESSCHASEKQAPDDVGDVSSNNAIRGLIEDKLSLLMNLSETSLDDFKSIRDGSEEKNQSSCMSSCEKETADGDDGLDKKASSMSAASQASLDELIQDCMANLQRFRDSLNILEEKYIVRYQQKPSKIARMIDKDMNYYESQVKRCRVMLRKLKNAKEKIACSPAEVHETDSRQGAFDFHPYTIENSESRTKVSPRRSPRVSPGGSPMLHVARKMSTNSARGDGFRSDDITPREGTKSLSPRRNVLRSTGNTQPQRHKQLQSPLANISPKVDLGIQTVEQTSELLADVPPMIKRQVFLEPLSPEMPSELMKMKVSIEVIEKELEQLRIADERNFSISLMTKEELRKEKTDMQKALLKFESTFGRPTSKLEKSLVKSVYARYSEVKKALRRYEEGAKFSPAHKAERSSTCQNSCCPSLKIFEEIKHTKGRLSEVGDANVDILKKACSPKNSLDDLEILLSKFSLEQLMDERLRLTDVQSDASVSLSPEKCNDKSIKINDGLLKHSYMGLEEVKAHLKLVESLIERQLKEINKN